MRTETTCKARGFTLIETLVGIGIFLLIASVSYQAYVGVSRLIIVNQNKISALNLANEQIEIVRNLSYASIGEVGGVPRGSIPHVQTIVRGGNSFTVTTTIRNIDLPFDGTIGGTPNDLSPADNKLVAVQIDCVLCRNFMPIILTTSVAPKNLETTSTNGALFIKAFDASGVVISGASVHIVNTKVTPNISIDDTTDTNGMLQIVNAPTSSSAYNITVTKSGYSTAKTYPPNGPGNPSPIQPDATVLLQKVTQTSFSIDKLSTLSFNSVTSMCTPVANVHFSLVGSKQIGLNLPKYSQNLITDSSGLYSNSSMEWDTYTAKSTDSTYDFIGINPLNPVTLNPNTTQNVSLIVAPKNPNSVLVTVKDSATQLPVANAYVLLTKSGYSSGQMTGRGSINQTDWSGGAGQSLYTISNKYFADSGGVSINNPVGQIVLANSGPGTYVPSGTLESSTIDTGSASNFYNLIWSPTDQPGATGAGSAKFQFASNSILTSTTTWSYVGPDGTASTYYTTSNAVLSSVHNGNRYIRYKVFLSTASPSATPNISDVAFTYTSQCTPPGQVIFPGLSSGTYTVAVGKAGYSTSTASVSATVPWVEQVISLGP